MIAPTVRPTPKPGILDIAPYVGGKSKVEGVANPTKLSSNENALGCSPAARAAYLAAADRLHLYPDGKAADLRAAVSARYGLEPERLVFGCGSDEVFSLLCQVYLQPGDNVVQGQYGFLAYRIGARAAQAEVRFAPEPDHRVDVDQMLAQVDERTRIVFLANPGNPTGTWLPGAEVRRLLAGLPPSVILVYDGAYAEFVTQPGYEDGLQLARDFPNVVATRTFSKIHGLAALRVGWGYADPAIVDAVERIRPPFNTTIPAHAAAVAALGDPAFEQASRDHVEQWRGWLASELSALGLAVVDSAANFLLVGFGSAARAQAADAHLAGAGLIVRAVAGYGLPEHLRITIGLEAHNRAVVAALAEFSRS